MKTTEHKLIIHKIIKKHFKQTPKYIRRIKTGISNEVYAVSIDNKTLIVRLNDHKKYLIGSHDHIPKFKKLKINVPVILAEDYSKKFVPIAYQIQSKIPGKDLGVVIEKLTSDQLKKLGKEIATIFKKIKTIPAYNQFGLIWGGGENDLSDTWSERMKLWLDESKLRGIKTNILDKEILKISENIYKKYKLYFNKIKPITYFGDICSKNVMIKNGKLNGLVDLDGLTQGDPLEAIGRIKLSWYNTRYGKIYTNAIMDELNLTSKQREIVTLYALINQISWMCENGIQFNLNTKAVVNKKKEKADKKIFWQIAQELNI